MNIEDFKREIDGMFPCRWAEDFIQDMQNVFNKYIDIVSTSICGIMYSGLNTSDVFFTIKLHANINGIRLIV